MSDRNDYVQLSCQKLACLLATKAATIDVPVAEYEPGKLKCDRCGEALTSYQETNLEQELIGMGLIDISKDVIRLGDSDNGAVNIYIQSSGALLIKNVIYGNSVELSREQSISLLAALTERFIG